jgi:hypothetical protein
MHHTSNLLDPTLNPHTQSTGIMGNEIADTLANEGTLKEKPSATPHIHLAHATPYWLANCPTATHDVAIRNLHTFVTKAQYNCEVMVAQTNSHT